MANLAKNSVWSNLSTSETDILGPTYSYADSIPGPSTLGVGTSGSFSQLGANASAVSTYVDALITGDPPLGNQFFVNTGGTCTAPDGSVKPRYNYINNMSSGTADVPASMKEIGSSFNGLIPGILGDIEGLNPLHLFTALTVDASPQCACYKCDVTTGSQYQFLTPNLSPDLQSGNCTQVDSSFCSNSGVESFSNPETSTVIPTVLAGLGLFVLVFSCK
jgi:hypothetical protein